SVARRAHIEELRADNRALSEGARRLEAGSAQHALIGQDVRSFAGGDVRHYLEGIALHGKHILILVDRSASMLHEDVVSVIRLRNADDATKRNASKWRRTVAIVDWLATALPAGSHYQIYAFNTRAEPLAPGTAATWLDSADPTALARGLEELRGLVPRDGTSLINAFAVAKTLNPLPDQIVLITDGLPTQGRTAPARKYIDAGARGHLFDEALGTLPPNVPTDIVLLPMRGEVQGAHRFWRLARLTQGTFLAPSKDWP
ncbi:MAG: VWA domain-containing protein, partial [Acetobacteraceae bacterium]|nr:VWA domain-containing protein [Acetobacteraceae bacterium]